MIKQKRGMSAWVWILIILIIIGAGIYFWLSGSGSFIPNPPALPN